MRTEPVAASVATVGTLATAATSAHEWIQLAVSVLTLVWWIRLWIKKPEVPPPSLPKK